VVTIDGNGADAFGALGVLATNVLCGCTAGTLTLLVQRWWRERTAPQSSNSSKGTA